MLHRANALLDSIEKEIKAVNEKYDQSQDKKSYLEKLERYKKFFKYRVIKVSGQ